MIKTATPTIVTPNSTTILGACLLFGVYINKPMTGTLVIKDGTITRGTIAAATAAGTFWGITHGNTFANLTIVSNNVADDVSVSVCGV